MGLAHQEHAGMRQGGDGRPTRAVGTPQILRTLASLAPLLALPGLNACTVVSCQARMAARTIRLSGSVWLPGMASTISQSRSMSACRRSVSAIAAGNWRLTATGSVRGLTLRSRRMSQAWGTNVGLLGQPPRTQPMLPCGATAPDALRVVYSGNQASSSAITVAASRSGLRCLTTWRVPA